MSSWSDSFATTWNGASAVPTEPGLSAPALVADAGPLIHLDELRCLELLEDFPVVRIPRQVWQEALRHRPAAFEVPGKSWLRVDVEVSREPELQTIVRSLSLDLGEQAALTLMRQHPESVLLTDDSAARLASKSLGFRAHGTLGVVLRAIRRGQRTRDEVLELLKRLPEISTLHLRHDLRLWVIRTVEQDSFASF